MTNPQPAPKFPHLLPVDAAIWAQHLATVADDYDRFEYDIRVGEGRDPGPTFADNMRKMALDLSRRRIDAIGYNTTGLDIFEVTHSAGFTALGQLVAYPILYRATYGGALPIRTNLIAGRIQTDIQPVLERLGIRFFTYPRP